MNSPLGLRCQNERQGGFALVAVLGFFVLTSFILFAFLESTRLRAVTAANEFQSFRYGLLAQAMVQLIADRVVEKTAAIDLRHPDKWYGCLVNNHSVYARVTDHAGLIDLNGAPAELISKGLVSLAVPVDLAHQISEGIIQYRRFDYGQIPSENDAALVPFGLKNAPFEDVIEVRDFKSLKPIEMESLYRTFTVDAKRSDVTTDRAPLALRFGKALTTSSGSTGITSSPISDALTVDLQIFRHSRLEYSGQAIFSLTNSDARMKFLPQDIGFKHQADSGADPLSCNTLFGTVATNMLLDVLK